MGFYESLLGSSNSVTQVDQTAIRDGPLVSQEQRDSLLAEVTVAEIKVALLSIGNDKAPGPDDFSSGFFKA